ncbi:unnamed protein product, partial [Prorocentrum cordatum]
DDAVFVPAENLIAAGREAGTRVAVVARSPEQVAGLAGALQLGVDALVLPCGAGGEPPPELWQAAVRLREERACAAAAGAAEEAPEPAESFAPARVTAVEAVGGLADRVCLDLVQLLREGEGALVGSTAKALCLVQGETAQTGLVPPRPFRINAGPVHAYVAMADGRTKYLSEVVAGDEVLVVDAEAVEEGGPLAASRSVAVGRCKTEPRPVLCVRFEDEGGCRTGQAFFQQAETVRLRARPEEGSAAEEGGAAAAGWRAVAVTALKPGDWLMLRWADRGTHVGRRRPWGALVELTALFAAAEAFVAAEAGSFVGCLGLFLSAQAFLRGLEQPVGPPPAAPLPLAAQATEYIGLCSASSEPDVSEVAQAPKRRTRRRQLPMSGTARLIPCADAPELEGGSEGDDSVSLLYSDGDLWENDRLPGLPVADASANCYKSCSDLTEGRFPSRFAPNGCCKELSLSCLNPDDVRFSMPWPGHGMMVGGDGKAPHPPGRCDPNEEGLLGLCYKKCSILTKGEYPIREVFKAATHKSDARKKQTMSQVRCRSSVQGALGDHVSELVQVLALGAGLPQRRGSDAIGTKRDDARGIFGACRSEDYKPAAWGLGDDRRRSDHESGRTGEYEVLRDQHRRRLSQSRTAPVQAPALSTPAGTRDQQKPKAVSEEESALRGPEALKALLWTASSGQISRQLLRQHARVEAMKFRSDNQVEEHCAADRDAVQLEGALLGLAADVGDKLAAARKSCQVAHKW